MQTTGEIAKFHGCQRVSDVFRADSIVQDAELIRQQLVPSDMQEGRWAILGQSFGGFCCVRYLSAAPGGEPKRCPSFKVPQQPICVHSLERMNMHLHSWVLLTWTRSAQQGLLGKGSNLPVANMTSFVRPSISSSSKISVIS